MSRPAALLDAPPTEVLERPPYAWAAAIGIAVFGLYALTLAPTTAFWDASEYITVAHILGIPHPPGNPLFVLLARAWELLLTPTGLPVAVRINLFSAANSAAAAACWFLVGDRVLGYVGAAPWQRRVGGATAAFLSAVPFTVWNQSNVNEKVYTISLFTIALITWLAFRWRDWTQAHRHRPGRWHDDNVLLLMAFLLALSVGNHLMAFLVTPALLVFLLRVRPRIFTNWRLYLGVLVVAVVGLSVHLYLPIRAKLNPIINEASPTCPSLGSAMVSILTFGNAGCPNLSAALQREQYAKPPVTQRQAPFWAQLANYAQYFDWQWARSVEGVQPYFAWGRLPFTLLFLLLGIYGAVRHWQRDRTSALYLLVLYLTLSVGLIYYLNFKYGYNQLVALGMTNWEAAEVRERDYFFLVSFSVWGLWAGLGLAILWLELQQRLARRRAGWWSAPVLGIVALPLVLNWPYASRAGDYAARDWAYNLLQSVEPYGILFTNGDNDTFPLWYLQEVEGIRRDVTVIVSSYFNTDWYAKQLRDLTRPCPAPNAWARDPTRIICQRPFDPRHAPAFYRSLARAPRQTILPLSDAQIQAIANPGYTVLTAPQVFESRGIRVEYPAGTVLTAADQFILWILKTTWGDRPVYFAATTNKHLELGLGNHVVRQGVALKLVTPQEAAMGDYVRVTDPQAASVLGAYIDVPRTAALLDRVLVHRDLLRRPHWVDDATRGIPTYYAYAHLALAQALQAQGRAREAQRHQRLYDAWMDLSRR
jgi:hypothetical protein